MDITDIPLPKPAFLGSFAKLTAKASDDNIVFENQSEVEENLKAQSKAGFDIVYAPQISTKCDEASEEIDDGLIASAVKITRQSVCEKTRIAGRVIPVGCEASEDGIDFFDTFSAYFRQARALFEAKVDLFIADDMRSVSDARAVVLACKRFDIPVFVTMAVDCDDITQATSYALSALICLQEMGADAFGISSACECSQMCEIISELASYAKIPIISRLYDVDKEDAAALVQSGASFIAGCSAELSETRLVCKQNEISSPVCVDASEDTLVLSNETQAFFLSPDNIEISEYIQCSQDMSDVLLDLEDTNTDIIGVELFNPDDAVLFMKNVHMASLPVIFKSQSITALTTALILYPGRACIDSCCDLGEGVLSSLAQRYGAIIY